MLNWVLLSPEDSTDEIIIKDCPIVSTDIYTANLIYHTLQKSKMHCIQMKHLTSSASFQYNKLNI
jgi:hypothetical protein